MRCLSGAVLPRSSLEGDRVKGRVRVRVRVRVRDRGSVKG